MTCCVLPDTKVCWGLRAPEESASAGESPYVLWLPAGTGIRTFDRQHPREMPEALEAGTLNGHGIAGLEAGLRYILEQGPEQLLKRERKLADLFLEETADIPGIRFYGDLGDPNRAPVVSLNLGERDSAEISGRLWAEYEISTRSGGHCAPLMHEALGTREQGTVRFSFSHYNTEQEIREAAGALREIGGKHEKNRDMVFHRGRGKKYPDSADRGGKSQDREKEFW